MKGDQSGFNYSELAQKARTLPDTKEGAPSNVVELAPVFKPPKNADSPYIETDVPDDKPALQMHYLSFTKVFVLWRPWEKCKRCITAIDQGTVTLPEQSDYSCPHTQKVAYKEIIDRGLKGNAVLTAKEPFNLPNGTRCVHVEWMEPDPEQKKKIEKEMEERKKNRVYPPDVAGFMAGKK